MRGQAEVKKFGKRMIEVLNNPKNAQKGDWNRLTWMQMVTLLKEEVAELEAECQLASYEGSANQEELFNEAADVAIFAMFLADKFRCLKTP